MIKSFKINTKAPLHDKALKSCSTSLPGGDLVDGLPPAASTKYSCLETGTTANFGLRTDPSFLAAGTRI